MDSKKPRAFLPDTEDFDLYCATAGIRSGDQPRAFAAWLNAIVGEHDGDSSCRPA
jgi:hypothetical protein